jgi:hypothetical protein
MHPSTEPAAGTESKSAQKSIVDIIIDTASKCSDDNDDNVQLQVVKVILVAVTSPLCHVHEAVLLLAIRSCFHVHLISRNPVNRTTAKAALTQMISYVNQKMEIYDNAIKSGQSVPQFADGDAEQSQRCVCNIYICR